MRGPLPLLPHSLRETRCSLSPTLQVLSSVMVLWRHRDPCVSQALFLTRGTIRVMSSSVSAVPRLTLPSMVREERTEQTPQEETPRCLFLNCSFRASMSVQ